MDDSAWNVKISRWLNVIPPAFRISHKLTYSLFQIEATHYAHTHTHICTTASDACPDSTSHTHTETHRLLWGTGMCVLLQAQVSGQQGQLTCLILSVMLFLYWQRNTLSVLLTLRERAERSVSLFCSLSLITFKWGHTVYAQQQFTSDLHMDLYYHRWLFSLSNRLNILHYFCLCVSLIFIKPVSGKFLYFGLFI